MNMDNLEKIVEYSNTYKEVLDYLGLNVNGSNYKKVKKKISDNGYSVEHFLSVSDFMKKYNTNRIVIPISEILIENSNYTNRTSLKIRLIKEKLIEYKCFKCENTGEWMGEKISLILDHINGVNNDNRLENLRFACPNCNATLDTHCGKNVKNKKNIKTPKELPKDFHIKKNEKLRVIERPNYITLLKEIKELGYSGTGKKYNVSDNAIRKWVKAYEKMI